jgi:hypothetical protein
VNSQTAYHSMTVVSAADTGFLAQFENCLLPENEWSHLAHIRVAWACLALTSFDVAIERIKHGILQYNTRVLGRRHKYHETVTIAFARIVASRMLAGESWEDFHLRIDDIVDPDKPILARYYSRELLASEEARHSFVGPDIDLLPEID